MKAKEKIAYLIENHFSQWIEERKKVEREFSDRQQLMCRYCGRLATGFHESHCTKFQNAVNAETAKRLSNLIKTKI